MTNRFKRILGLSGITIAFVCAFVIILLNTDIIAGSQLTTTTTTTQQSSTNQAPIWVMLDGHLLDFDVQPTIINDRVMVPMRTIFEALGASIEWDSINRRITATRNDLVVIATIGDRNMYVNGIRTVMDVAPTIVNDRTLVPVRFVSEAFGADVEWVNETRVVIISSIIDDIDWDNWTLDDFDWVEWDRP